MESLSSKIIGWMRRRLAALRRQPRYQLLINYELEEELPQGELLLVDLGPEAGPNNVAVVPELEEEEESENMAAMRELSLALEGAADAASQARGALCEALAEVERLQRELDQSRRSQAAAEEERDIWMERWGEAAEQIIYAVEQLEQAELPVVSAAAAAEEAVQGEEEEEDLDDTMTVEEVFGAAEEEVSFYMEFEE
jgi:chromosome segregation ATPase